MTAESRIISKLRSELPPTFARTEVDQLCGGIIASRTIANLQSLGQGPGGAFRVGRKMCFERDAFLDWLARRIREQA